MEETIVETLRYFFSAIFQGIAAILTLGAMFYMNYLDRARNRINDLEIKARISQSDLLSEDIQTSTRNIIELIWERVDSRTNQKGKKIAGYDDMKSIYDQYVLLTSKEKYLKENLPGLVKKGIFLLVLSSISLFLVGLNCYLNYLLYLFGIVCIIYTIIYLMNLKTIIFKSSDITKKQK